MAHVRQQEADSHLVKSCQLSGVIVLDAQLGTGGAPGSPIPLHFPTPYAKTRISSPMYTPMAILTKIKHAFAIRIIAMGSAGAPSCHGRSQSIKSLGPSWVVQLASP